MASGSSSKECPRQSFARDWNANPSLWKRSGFSGTLYIMGDVHGRFSELQALLDGAGVAGGTTENPRWLAGASILVFIGDLINKGQESLSVVTFVRNLQKAASAAGGAVVVMPGNHEIGFLIDPFDKKSEEFQKNLKSAKLDLCDDAYSPKSALGGWLRSLPLAAQVNGVFMSHTGYAYEATPGDWDEHYRLFLESQEIPKKSLNFACGKDGDRVQIQGFFTATAWWGKDGDTLRAQQQSLGARAFVFGHDPSAFRDKGKILGYFGDSNGSALIKIDTGLGELVSRGSLLRCGQWLPNGGCKQFEVHESPSQPGGSSAKFKPLTISPSAPPKEDSGAYDRGC
jgi:hypothetical protein